jgi:hypothetical protein
MGHQDSINGGVVEASGTHARQDLLGGQPTVDQHTRARIPDIRTVTLRSR